MWGKKRKKKTEAGTRVHVHTGDVWTRVRACRRRCDAKPGWKSSGEGIPASTSSYSACCVARASAHLLLRPYFLSLSLYIYIPLFLSLHSVDVDVDVGARERVSTLAAGGAISSMAAGGPEGRGGTERGRKREKE